MYDVSWLLSSYLIAHDSFRYMSYVWYILLFWFCYISLLQLSLLFHKCLVSSCCTFLCIWFLSNVWQFHQVYLLCLISCTIWSSFSVGPLTFQILILITFLLYFPLTFYFSMHIKKRSRERIRLRNRLINWICLIVLLDIPPLIVSKWVIWLTIVFTKCSFEITTKFLK